MPPEPARRGGGGRGEGGGGAAPVAPAATTSALMGASSGAAASSRPLFVGAPITKLLLGIVVISYAALHSHHWNQSSLVQAFEPTLRRFTYPTLSELIVMGSLATTWSRTLERSMGSKQLVRLIVVLTVVSFMCRQFLWATFLYPYVNQDPLDNNTLASSSYRYTDLYVGVLFWFYHRYTPRLHPRFVNLPRGNLHGSEKTLYYLWFLYGLVLASRNSTTQSMTIVYWAAPNPRLVAVSVGVLSGALFPALSRFAIVPDRLASFVASRIGPLLQAPPPLYVPVFGGVLGATGTNTAFVGQHGQYRPNPIAHQAAAAAAAAAAPVAPRRVPRPAATAATGTDSNSAGGSRGGQANIVVDPTAVETLIGMGFERSQVEQALRATHNDVQGAANLLLASA